MSTTDPAFSGQRSVSFILIPGFALTSFSLAVEALSVANGSSDACLYEYTLYGVSPDADSTLIYSSNGIPIHTDYHFSACAPCDIIVVCAHRNAERYNDPKLMSLLKRQHRQGGLVVSLSNGSLVLAMANILTNRGCTLVGEDMAVFQELYPAIPISQQVYTVDENVMTCAGGTSALDLFLYIIGRERGTQMANAISHKFLQDRVRSPKEMQTARRSFELRLRSPILGAAIEIMEANLGNPLPIHTIATRVATTPRTLEHVFKRHESTTPARYYLNLRLDKASHMIETSKLSMISIAYATGFHSPSYFSKCFRKRFGRSPTALRNSQK